MFTWVVVGRHVAARSRRSGFRFGWLLRQWDSVVSEGDLMVDAKTQLWLKLHGTNAPHSPRIVSQASSSRSVCNRGNNQEFPSPEGGGADEDGSFQYRGRWLFIKLQQLAWALWNLIFIFCIWSSSQEFIWTIKCLPFSIPYHPLASAIKYYHPKLKWRVTFLQQIQCTQTY